MFTDEEIACPGSARLATDAADGRLAVDAVGFQFDGERFLVGGHVLARSRTYRTIAACKRYVAPIIDDLAAADPWTPRGNKVHGTAEVVTREGMFGPGEYCSIASGVTWSWGVVAPAFARGRFAPHRIAWTAR